MPFDTFLKLQDIAGESEEIKQTLDEFGDLIDERSKELLTVMAELDEPGFTFDYFNLSAPPKTARVESFILNFSKVSLDYDEQPDSSAEDLFRDLSAILEAEGIDADISLVGSPVDEGEVFLKIKMEDLLISSFQTGGSGSDDAEQQPVAVFDDGLLL